MRLASFLTISNNKLYIQNELCHDFKSYDSIELKKYYRSLNIDYPKFFKMDDFSKICFLAFSSLKNKYDFSLFNDDEVSLIFSNPNSSYNTDLEYLDSYLKGSSPSPSLFIYTLPNIVIGELSILNKWHGESCFFINDNFDPQFFLDQINFHFDKGSKICVCCWLNTLQDKTEMFMFIVENANGNLNRNDLLRYYNLK